MGFVKGTDGIARTVRNPLEGSIGDITLNDVSVTTLSASANITTSGNSVAVGNVSGGNVVATALVRGVTVQASGNLTGGNANISNGVFATTGGFGGNVSVGNLSTGGQVFAIGNVTGGNVVTAGNLSAGNLSLSGNIAGNIGFTGTDIIINNAPGGQEGGELKWALPAPANTVLSTSLTQDVFQNGMRFFETGGNTRGLYIDLGNAPNISTTAVGYRDIPQVSFTGNTTIATTDAGRHYYSTQSTGYTLTIANNASQGFQTGAAITIINQGTGTITVAQGSGVTLYLAGNVTSGNRTVATFGMATLIKVATDTWFINGTGVS